MPLDLKYSMADKLYFKDRASHWVTRGVAGKVEHCKFLLGYNIKGDIGDNWPGLILFPRLEVLQIAFGLILYEPPQYCKCFESSFVVSN